MKRWALRLILVISFVFAALIVTGLGYPTKTAALSGSEFQAGRIMDDGIFFNGNTMSVAQIQEFLNAKVPVCDTNGTQPYAGTTRAAYSTARGNPPPFVCLKDFRQDTPAKGADAYCGFYGGGNNSAAEIIYHISRTCGISQKTLLVLLQKEQSLITDDWPWSRQYRSATGYGCPDTAPCDAEYFGFFNQVYMAARQFKRYAGVPGNYNYRKERNNFIQYNPNAGCGGTNVFITNQATAGLYNYTPYQPNAAALQNLYGTGDGCSAYGNRNFWRMYRDWFGGTTGHDYEWSFDDIEISTGSSTVTAHEPTTITIKARNRGNQAWSNTNFPVRLGTFSPTNHDSPLYDESWVSPHRPATLNESVVEPGQLGTFTFTINPPNQAGSYTEQFNLVAEGATWFNSSAYTLHIVINPVSYTWQMVSQSSSTGSFVLTPGSTAQFTLVAKNTGNVTWKNSTNPVRLATWSPTNRSSSFYHSSWVLPVRPAVLQEASVAPGQNGTFTFTVTAPQQQKMYYERFNLVMEGRSWFEDPWLEFQVLVKRDLSWQMVSQSSSTGSFILAPGATSNFTLIAKNTGNMTWTNSGSNPVRLGTWSPTDRQSTFRHASWPLSVRPAVLQEASVAPGQNGTFTFTVTAPQQQKMYYERFNLVMEGIAWMNDPWLEFQVLVRN